MPQRCKMDLDARIERAYQWAVPHFASGDIDPVYFMFPLVQKHFGEQGLWDFVVSRTHLYDAGAMLYTVSDQAADGKGWAAALQEISAQLPPEFHMNPERRVLYNTKAAIAGARAMSGDGNFLPGLVKAAQPKPGDPFRFAKFQADIEQTPSLGTWAAYSLISHLYSAMLIGENIDWDGVKYNDTIRTGAAYIWTGNDDEPASNSGAHKVIQHLVGVWKDRDLRGVPYYVKPLNEIDVETIVCKFLHTERNSYWHGADLVGVRKSLHKWYHRYKECPKAKAVALELEESWAANKAVAPLLRKMHNEGFVEWGEPSRQKGFSFATSSEEPSGNVGQEKYCRKGEQPPPPPFVDKANWGRVIQVIGAFASGKTELVRRLLKDTDTDPLMSSVQDPFVRGEFDGCPFSVMGPYHPDVGVGGLDKTMHFDSLDNLMLLIAQEVMRGRTVIFEQALTLGFARAKYLAEATENRYTLIMLDIPQEQREANLAKRRATTGNRGEITQKTRDNMINKQRGAEAYLREAKKLPEGNTTFAAQEFDQAEKLIRAIITGPNKE